MADRGLNPDLWVVVVVRMIKLQDHFLLTRRTEPVGVKQDLHSLQASGKSHNVHL